MPRSSRTLRLVCTGTRIYDFPGVVTWLSVLQSRSTYFVWYVR